LRPKILAAMHRLLVANQEVVELQIYLRQVDRDAEQGGSDFVDARDE
jgi:hypothetical protein